jgi:hypothetical protein
VSWDWGQIYLPEDIHSELSEFHTALASLQEYMFADRDEGSLVVLGFGLLLRDCWTVVELEEGDEDFPQFLHKSLLDIHKVKQVFKAIEKVIGRLPPPDTAEERPKKLELEGSAKRRKASTNRKKPVARKGLAHTPPPVPSTSKQSDTQKDGNIPARNVRSQRQRMPSKKLRDSD